MEKKIVDTLEIISPGNNRHVLTADRVMIQIGLEHREEADTLIPLSLCHSPAGCVRVYPPSSSRVQAAQ